MAAGAGGRTPREPIGWIAWESNRTGEFRIWLRALAGGEPRQISPDEPGRDHCCAHLSPDGERLLYLSLPGGARGYLPATTDGELRLVRTDGGGHRTLASPARHYGEHRAAVWWSETELVYIPDDRSTRKLDLASGREERVADSPAALGACLIEPTGRWATAGLPTFSAVDPDRRAVLAATPLGGCQPYFTADGERGFWSAGAGGPIDVIDPATRATRSIVLKNDRRLPEGWRYVYFPMVSRDRTLLAWAASDGAHDHFRSDYEIFVAEIDPDTLELAGEPLRISRHPDVDRFPDVWRLAPVGTEVRRTAPAAPATRSAGAPVFLWRSSTDANRRDPTAASELLETDGPVWFDRFGRMALAGGRFAAAPDRALELDAALKSTNTLTVALLLEPFALDAGSGGPIVALAFSDKERGFVLRQDGDRLGFVLRRSHSLGRLGGPAWGVGRLPAPGPHHFALRFSPGRAAAFLDGRPVWSDVAPDDFYHWRNRALWFGRELGSDESFRGWVSQVVIWNRELSTDEIAVEAENALATVRSAPAVERLDLEARLVARSRVPTLAEISPYRSALVVEEYERGDGVPGRVRVARWALLDGRPTAALRRAPGERARLRLEPFDAQPQLESVVLSDTLPRTAGSPLWFATGLDGG